MSPEKLAVMVSLVTVDGAVADVLNALEVTVGVDVANTVPDEEDSDIVTPLIALLPEVVSIRVPDTVSVPPHGVLGMLLSDMAVLCFKLLNDTIGLPEGSIEDVPVKLARIVIDPAAGTVIVVEYSPK